MGVERLDHILKVHDHPKRSSRDEMREGLDGGRQGQL